MGSQRGPNTERARKALDAMKALGFSKRIAAPILKDLLKVYDKKWELIEDDNYSALADAILERQTNGDQAQKNDDPGSHKPTPENHRKQATSSVAAISGVFSDSDDETGMPRSKRSRPNSTAFTSDQEGISLDPSLPPSIAEPAMVISPQRCPAEINHARTRPSTRSCQAAVQNKPREMIDEEFQDVVFLREPKPEPHVDLVDGRASSSDRQNDKLGFTAHPRNANSSGPGVPLALPVPDQNLIRNSGTKNRTLQRCRNREMPTSLGKPTGSMGDTGAGSRFGSTQEAPCVGIDVASSTMGEVKLSLKCSIDPSKFRMPSLTSVFKMVEDKCLDSRNTIRPEFSIGNLMTEICQSVVHLGTDHATEHNIQSDVSNGSRSWNDPMTSNVPVVKPIASQNGGNGNYKAGEESLVLEREDGPSSPTVALQQHCSALAVWRCIDDEIDISKGEESIRVSVVNEFGSEKCPHFFYIPRNIIFENACVDISVARIGDEDCCADCFGNCLSAPVPCACARETGDEYAYTLGGLVRPAFIDECVSMDRFPEKHHMSFCKNCPLESSSHEASRKPCRGHLVRKFIKECWTKCGCNMQCGNRVVQRGIAYNLQVFFTGEGTGWGLRTLDELPKGAFVCEFAGEILTTTELHARAVQNMQIGSHTHPILLDADWRSERVLRDKEALCLDTTFYGNVGRFINHRCYDENLVGIPVEIESPDHHFYHLAFFTSRKVEPFEELTWDYGIDFDDDKHSGKAFQCQCGSRYCRDRKRPRTRSNAAAE